MRPAVQLPAGIAFFLTEWLLFAIGDRAHAVWADAGLFESTLDLRRAAVPESQVVFRGALLVAVAGDDDFDFGVLFEEGCVVLDSDELIGPDGIVVRIEKDVQPGSLLGCECFLRVVRRPLRRGGEDSDTRVGFFYATRAFGGEPVGGGVAGSDRLGSAGRDSADGVDAYIGGILGFPCENHWLARPHRGGRRLDRRG